MRFIRSAAVTLTLAVAAALAVSAGPALAANPVIDVTPSTATPGASVTFAITCGTGSTSATLFGNTLGLPEQIPMDSATPTLRLITCGGDYDAQTHHYLDRTIAFAAYAGERPASGRRR
jgi:hypothetical protein